MPDSQNPTPTIPEPNSPTPDTTGLAPNIAAGIACVFTIVGGVVFLVLEKKDKFVRFWAMQSVFLGGLALAVTVLVRIAYAVFDFIPLVGKLLMALAWVANLLFGLAWFIVYVICVVKAFSRQEWEIPWLGKLARKQLAQTDNVANPPTS